MNRYHCIHVYTTIRILINYKIWRFMISEIGLRNYFPNFVFYKVGENDTYETVRTNCCKVVENTEFPWLIFILQMYNRLYINYIEIILRHEISKTFTAPVTILFLYSHGFLFCLREQYKWPNTATAQSHETPTLEPLRLSGGCLWPFIPLTSTVTHCSLTYCNTPEINGTQKWIREHTSILLTYFR